MPFGEKPAVLIIVETKMTNNDTTYCFANTFVCQSVAEWEMFREATGTLLAIVAGIFGLFKIYQELKQLNEKKEKDNYDKEISAKLRRTQFFLDQHRRLFDDAELYSVLRLIDQDDPSWRRVPGCSIKKENS